MHKYLLTLLLLASSAFSVAQTSPAKPLIPAANLLADYEILHHAYADLHPGLTRYNTPSQMAEHYATLKTALSHDQTLADAFLRISEFTASVQCGHSYPNFTNQPAAVARQLFDAATIPFEFRWIDRQMIVTRNASGDASISPGARVLTIDEQPVEAILARLLTVARADGANDAKRIDLMQVQDTEKIEAFDVYYALYFPSSRPAMTISFIAPGNTQVQTASVMRMTSGERQRRLPPVSAPASADEPAWQLTFPTASTAVLRMPTWALFNSKRDWKADLNGTFAQLEEHHARNLIIDLRANEGGLSVGDAIAGHLIGHEQQVPQSARLVRYRRIPDALQPYLDTWDPTFRDWGARAVDDRDGFYRLQADDDDLIRPLAPTFSGKVAVLVGAQNSSATFEFAQFMQHNNLGKLVGQPTGGNQRGINGGAFFFVRLPNTGIEVDLPLIGFFPVNPGPNAGLPPDLQIVPTAQSIAAGRDLEMEAALASF